MTPTRPGTLFGPALQNFFALRADGEASAATPCDARTALVLLTLAAAEEAGRHRLAASAWSAGIFQNSPDAANAWAAYQRRLETSLSQAPQDLAAVLHLATQAPGGGGEMLAELRSLLIETDPELFSQGLVELAQRNLSTRRAPTFSQELLRLAQSHSATRARADHELNLLNGGGGFGAQLEYQAPYLLRELSSPLMLASFGTAMLTARAASLAVLARSSRFGWGTLLASEAAALAVEVPTLTFGHRIGAQLFFGGDGVFAGEGLANELLAGYTTFGLLRTFGNGLQLAAPSLRRVAGLNQASGAFSRLGRFTFESLRLGGELSAVAAGHSLNVTFGFEPAPAAAAQPWLQAMLTVGHMRLAGHLMHRLGLNPLHGAVEAQRHSLTLGRVPALLGETPLHEGHHLRSGVTHELETGLREGRLGPLTLESWIHSARAGRHSELSPVMERRGLVQTARWFRASEDILGSGPDAGLRFLPDLAFAGTAGRPRRAFDPRMIHTSLMSSDSPGGGRKSDPPTRRDVLVELLQQNLAEYTQKAETRDTVLGKAAKRLQDLLERIERPDLEHDEAFLRSLEEVEVELRSAQEHGSTLRRSVETLKVLFRRSAASGNAALEPEVVEQKSAQLEADEAQRSAFANSLAKMQEVLKKARDFGWSDELYGQLDRTKNSLNGFYGRTVYRIPWLNRLLSRASSLEDISQRRHGAILGLALVGEPGFPESPVTQRLRGLEPEAGFHDIDLELLHESILLASRKAWNPHELQSTLQRMADVYRSSEETRSALVLTAQAVNSLVHQGRSGPDLLELLRTMPEALAFGDHIVAVEAFRDPQSDFVIGLQQLGPQPVAADYLANGLLVLLRSGGDGARLLELMHSAREARVAGYHPSIAVSLFGASYGRSSIPESLLPSGGHAESFLIRALPPEEK